MSGRPEKLLCEEGFRNVGSTGDPSAFQFQVRLAYTRDIDLAMIDGLEVAVDGEKFPAAAISLGFGDRRFRLAELRAHRDTHWASGEPAKVIVAKPGGLPRGAHTVTITQRLRIPEITGVCLATETRTLVLGS